MPKRQTQVIVVLPVLLVEAGWIIAALLRRPATTG